MTYVRTENGIEKLDADREHLAKYMNGKQADSIKELCDEFVAFENGFLRPRLEFKNIDKTVLDAFLHCAKIECPNAELFGSIWTKKGLIHVAKINEKGELELL